MSDVIECPDHGPMRRITRMGVLVDIRCETCWNRPIDLLERSHVRCPICRVSPCYCDTIVDDEFGLTMDPCEHPSINGTTCAACGQEVPDGR